MWNPMECKRDKFSRAFGGAIRHTENVFHMLLNPNLETNNDIQSFFVSFKNWDFRHLFSQILIFLIYFHKACSKLKLLNKK